MKRILAIIAVLAATVVRAQWTGLGTDETQTLTNKTIDGATITGNIDGTGAIQLGAIPIVLEGATDNAYQLYIAVADIASSTKTATFQDFTGYLVIDTSACNDITGDGLEISGTTLQIDFNSTNLKITSNEIDTIQNIDTTASPTFAGLTDLKKLNWNNATELTIDGAGAVTITQSYHTLDGAGDANDELVTINGGNQGDMLIIRPENAARNITLKHSTGNILCGSASDFQLPDTGYAILVKDGTNWHSGESGGGAVGLHASSHQHGGADEISSATPGANVIPNAGAGGDLDAWISAASTTVPGIVEIATGTETNTGTDATRAVSPDGLDDWTGSAQITTVGTLSSGDATAVVSAATDSAAGKVELATDAETITGTATDRVTTPANVTARLASPSPIGSTAPSTGAFTTLNLSDIATLENGEILSNAVDATVKVLADEATLDVLFSTTGATSTIDLKMGISGSEQSILTFDDPGGETLKILREAESNVTVFSDSTTGEIQEFRIYGYPTGESLKYGSMKIIAGPKLQICSDTGEITFADENLVTTGTFGCGALTATGTTTLATALTGVVRADSGVLSIDGDVTDIVSAATLTAAGKIEIATGAETNAGTDATRAVSPDGLDDWTGSAQIATVGTLSAGDVTAQVSAATDSLAGRVELSTDAEAATGTATDKALVPANLVHSREAHWQELATSKYTATPSDTDTLAMSDTTDVAVGVPIRYTISSVVYYGQVVAETGNTSIDIVGASLGGDVTKLEVGQAQRIVIVPMYVDSTYGDGAEANLLAVDMTTYIKWRLGKAYCVSFSCIHSGVDTGAEPKINVQINNAAVSSNDTNNGVQLGAAATWVDNSAVAITTASYDINFDEELEVECTVAGGTGDAEDLTVIATFVLE